MYDYAPYVPVAERRKKAEKAVAALKKKGHTITPVIVTGRAIATSFWGKSWCTHLESYSDYANRLPRGRTYVRNRSVVHLGVAPGKVEARVSGSSMYTVSITVEKLATRRWNTFVTECSGKVDSLLALLKGTLSKGIMEIVVDRDRGLFPSPKEISFDCSCPDSASMCKHVAATLYGVGARLDANPELLFHLRQVDPAALFASSLAATKKRATRKRPVGIDDEALASVFGIEIDDRGPSPRR